MKYGFIVAAVVLLLVQGAANHPLLAAASVGQVPCKTAALRQIRSFGINNAPIKANEGTLFFRNFEVDIQMLPNTCTVATMDIIAKVHPFHLRLANLSSWLASIDVKSEELPFKGFIATVTARNGHSTGFPFETGTPVVMISGIETQNRHIAVSNHPYTDAPGMGIARWHGQPFFFAQQWDEPAPHNPPELWPDCP